MLDQFAEEDEKQRIRSIISKVLLLQGKNRFFAKLTGPPRITFLNSIFPDAIFIHVIRDPRANISSLLRVTFWKKSGGLERPWWQGGLSSESIGEWKNSGRSPVALAAVQWKEILEVAWRESKTIDESRYIELHYEDFVSNPYKTLADLFEKIDLSDSKIVFRYINSIGTVQDMNYKYKLNLANRDISLIEKLTMETARKAGYLFKS